MLSKILILTVLVSVAIAAAPATQPDLSTPQTAARAYYDALYGGSWAALDATTVNDEASTAWLKAIQHAIPVALRFGEAVRGKFGDDAVTKFMAGNPHDEMIKNLPNAQVTIDGDRAKLEVHLTTHSKQMLTFAKIDDAWKYDARETNNPRRSEMTRETIVRTDKIAKLTDRVDSGEFKTVDELQAVYRREVMPHAASSAPGRSSEKSK